LEGTVSFGPIELAVDARVLIPRPETEYLFGLLSRRPVAPALIVDVCTGSGALALALRWRFPSARVIGTDVSAEALTVAGANGATLGLEVEWLLSDLLDALPVDLKGTVDLLVANPPYVAEAEWPRLPPDVRHEPYQALVAGPDGTELIRRLLATLPRWMAEGGEGWIEIGETQGPRLVDEFEVEIVDDQYERNRFLRWRA
jgi:release factor glutamine methyltransferase